MTPSVKKHEAAKMQTQQQQQQQLQQQQQINNIQIAIATNSKKWQHACKQLQKQQ